MKLESSHEIPTPSGLIGNEDIRVAPLHFSSNMLIQLLCNKPLRWEEISILSIP